MECYLRLAGMDVRISALDLQEKEQALMTEQEDRTLRCMEVLMEIGVCSEQDYAMKVLNFYHTSEKLHSTPSKRFYGHPLLLPVVLDGH